ncbi:Uncharacterized membrane protein YeaQ/YmgE, transglycosylase-associated protein family [Pseudarcicella hirudinis]|uniref:Uncharacterized membrane protein YeaQ/YmgE, transglycosylase-associated protein family n=1 Tax=Pseudarcicella hirudinis TaxID=1079859 RepID=A0A1I5VE88_9BACT|nr:GlsB/YeaQ/YmgE family stress response membrane protein [Pseudarcicella hirudinis]SFQ05854.1 Uncharacterized membrane protein YeaQ/YmgE, transglycosylase-associated protein family [Pseudarcicella hirudinis]
MSHWLYSLIIGGIAGWLAGIIMNGTGFGLLIDIVVGVIGSIIGSWVFGLLGIHSGGGMIGSIIVSLVGAVILIFIIKQIKK